MLIAAKDDLERRRRVWPLLASPLFDVVFDEDTPESEWQRIGIALVRSGYHEDEIREIYWSEVVPAVTGCWRGVDPLNLPWLEDRIAKPVRLGYLLTCLLRPWWIWFAHGIWRDISRSLKVTRLQQSRLEPPESEPFACIEDLIHERK